MLVCKGLAEEMDMPVKGKRSTLGTLWGPMNDPNINGTHPALLAALRCNSDVQVPYRFPVTEFIHNDAHCWKSCHLAQSTQETVREAQRNQAAQAGYACDYQNKRHPIAMHEVKEWQKGQGVLHQEVQGKPTGYVGARTAKNIMTSSYCRGVSRGSVECANLLTHATSSDPVKAESIRSAPVVEISMSFGLKLMEAACAGESWPTEPRRLVIDNRPRSSKSVVSCPFWTLYGHRGTDLRVAQLSAYEFAMRYHQKMAAHPITLEIARLTESGRAKLGRRRQEQLAPGQPLSPTHNKRNEAQLILATASQKIALCQAKVGVDM